MGYVPSTNNYGRLCYANLNVDALSSQLHFEHFSVD